MNVLDIVLLSLLGLAAFSGYRRGLALQAFAFGGLLVGLVLGAIVAPPVARLVESPGAQAGVAAITLLALAAAGDTVGWLLGHRARERARGSRFGPVDAAGGSVVAVLASLLAIWFVALNLVNGPFPTVAHEIRGSAVVRTLDDALPEPPSLLAQVQRFFDRFGFPAVFSGIPPLPVAPVTEPSSAEVRAAVAVGSRGTVKIYGEACGHVQEGSGFVADDGYVVTNAHVVAGIDDPFVEAPGGSTQHATTVLFDPDLDLAVLFVHDSAGRILALAADDAERGDVGAVLGYPGGGPLTSSGAAVLRPMDPLGRDIYGNGEVVRSVLELQVAVHPGNSGGPFVTPEGTVAGVVFAASSTEDDVGYAIASEEVRPRLADAVGVTEAVATGPCVR